MKVGFVSHLGPGAADGPIGVRVKEVDLSLELIRAAPIVVPFKKRQIVAAANRNCLREIPHGADVPFPEKNHDSVGVAPLEIQNHCPSPVRGAILADYDFIVKIDLLGQHALDRLPNESLMIVSDHRDAELHTGECNVVVPGVPER